MLQKEIEHKNKGRKIDDSRIKERYKSSSVIRIQTHGLYSCNANHFLEIYQ